MSRGTSWRLIAPFMNLTRGEKRNMGRQALWAFIGILVLVVLFYCSGPVITRILPQFFTP